MKKWHPFSIVLTTLVFGLLTVEAAQAEDSRTGEGIIEFEVKEETGIRDPEHPGTIVDPGESPSTTGELRIDFVPKLNFHQYKRSDEDQLYPVNAQLFHDETTPRGTFVQVSDFREGAKGWTLQVRQETQFKNDQTENTQLNGAVISFDKSWTNSVRESDKAPTVKKDIIRLSNIGETYNLAEAKPGTGTGLWLISFGASENNPLGQVSTLKPRMQDGQSVTDPVYANQNVYENSAVQLSIPGKTKKDPVTYSTVLTWLLAELP